MSSTGESPQSGKDIDYKLSKRVSLNSTASSSDLSKISCRSRLSKRSKGTILNAVPQAKTIQMSPLEEEMATSPNDEIISAISDHPPTLKALAFDSQPSPFPPQDGRFKSSPSLGQHSKAKRRKDVNSRVGVWVDGIVHWDESMIDVGKQTAAVEETGFTPVRPANAQVTGDKPSLSVVIPANSSESTSSVPKIMQPQPRRPVSLTNPASGFSRSQGMVPEKARQTLGLPPDVGRPFTPQTRTTEPANTRTENFLASRSSSSSSSAMNDSSSVYSRRSSATSMEQSNSSSPLDSKPLPPTPPSEPQAPPRSKYRPYRPGVPARPSQNTNKPKTKHVKGARSVSELDDCDRDFLRASPYQRGSPSPTLSQAEQDLRYQLAALSPKSKRKPADKREAATAAAPGIRRKSSVSEIMQPPSRAPTIPRRSRKREWRAPKQGNNSGYLPAPKVPSRRRSEAELNKASVPTHEAAPIRKAASVHNYSRSTDSTSSASTGRPGSLHIAQLQQLTASVPNIIVNAEASETPEVSAESAEEGQGDLQNDEAEQHETILEEDETEIAVPTTSAENVLLCILSSLSSPADLFNTAIINKGMYRVYKENEMYLLRTIAYNQSPPAYEFREWSPPGRSDGSGSPKSPPQPEHTPISYMRSYRRGVVVIERLKKLILDHCQTFIRKETAAALADPDHPCAQRFSDAFWRIWCFCKIFGCNKGREDDITGQLDWLKGGLLANNQDTSATVNTNLDFDMSSVLLNAPEYFAAANEGGLSAAQLFDMTELWTCMTVLLQGYHDRVDQARQYGVFAKCNIAKGDLEKEEEALEEWTSYLLTLGPHVVLAMAQHMEMDDEKGFVMAKKYGWTSWTPPMYSSSRTNFLKEPVAKSYEAQVSAAKMRLQDPRELEMKERSRQRVATLAAEIRLRRQSSEYKRLPLIGMDGERAMSVMSRRDSAYSNRSGRSNASRATSSSRYSSAAPSTPSSLWEAPNPKKFSTIIEERWESNPNLQNFGGGAEDSSDMAVKRIVSMGFTPAQAKEALRLTDMGDGLRLDRAVEVLLRQQ